MAIEDTGQYKGVYHVLGGIISPIEGIGPQNLKIESLVEKASLLNIESRYITRIFTAIIEDSVRYQQEYVQAKITPSTKNNLSKSVAVLGGVGAYSHLAAKQFFAKSDNQYDACDSFDEIIQKSRRIMITPLLST